MHWLPQIPDTWLASGAKFAPILLGVLIFASVSLFCFAVFRALKDRTEIRQRSKQWDRDYVIDKIAVDKRDGKQAAEFLARIGRFIAPNDAQSYSVARLDMVRAGFFSPRAVPIFHAVRLILGFGLPIVAVLALGTFPLGLSSTAILIAVAMASGLGFIAPSFYIQNRQKRMKHQYRSGFPDFMDLLVVCAESGMALQPAIGRISREIVPTSPQLAANLHLAGLELRAGSSLKDALEGLTQRLGIDEAASLASLLKQSDELDVQQKRRKWR